MQGAAGALRGEAGGCPVQDTAGPAAGPPATLVLPQCKSTSEGVKCWPAVRARG